MRVHKRVGVSASTRNLPLVNDCFDQPHDRHVASLSEIKHHVVGRKGLRNATSSTLLSLATSEIWTRTLTSNFQQTLSSPSITNPRDYDPTAMLHIYPQYLMNHFFFSCSGGNDNERQRWKKIRNGVYIYFVCVCVRNRIEKWSWRIQLNVSNRLPTSWIRSFLMLQQVELARHVIRFMVTSQSNHMYHIDQ